ncbi:MAG TPA: hypothetical protein VK508_15690 [Cyclobacteriaceae bacterium]|nr:hypothetical protein [Cyclobacteriaceae bacterium]
MARQKINKQTQTAILLECRRRCCICFGLEGNLDEKRGQIAHLDHSPNNNDPDNLAFLCLEHHDQYDSGTSQSKGLTKEEVKAYKEELIDHFDQQRNPVKHEPSLSNVIGVSYMRLFGAVETPLLMSLFESPAQEVMPMGDNGPTDFYIIGTKGPTLHKNLFDFWTKRWQYKDAIPLKTELWTKCSGSRSMANDIYWTALSPTVEDLMSYCSHSDINEDGNLPNTARELLNLKYSDEELYALQGTQSSDVGFLFVILTNQGKSDVHELHLNYNFVTNALQFIQGGSLRDNMSKKEPREVALNDGLISERPKDMRTLKIASLASNTSLLWLLCIYRKKKNGLPDFYLGDVTIPTGLSCELEGERIDQTIRQPYGELAARMHVPSGWFNQ